MVRLDRWSKALGVTACIGMWKVGRRKDEELLITADHKATAHIWGYAPDKTLNYGPNASCHPESTASWFYCWFCETSKNPSPCLWWGERSDASLLSPLSFQDTLSYKATSWERKALSHDRNGTWLWGNLSSPDEPVWSPHDSFTHTYIIHTYILDAFHFL